MPASLIQQPALYLLAGKHRAKLSQSDVISIFQAKATRVQATVVASSYGVSEKAVRPHLGKRDVASQPVADPDCETDRTSQGLERLAAKTEAHAPQQPSIGQT